MIIIYDCGIAINIRDDVYNKLKDYKMEVITDKICDMIVSSDFRWHDTSQAADGHVIADKKGD